MFLSVLKRRNPALLEAAAVLHQTGKIPPNCYVLDLDAIGANASAIAAETDRLGLQVFAMTKQIGRNPDVSRCLVEHGITHAVGVDLECAAAAVAGGLGLGHLGHLVQIPRHQAPAGAVLEPLHWTVFSREKASEAAAANAHLGREQDFLVRVIEPTDLFYPGHEGGVPVSEVTSLADAIDAMPGARFAGITTFPAALYDPQSRTVQPTPNVRTLEAAAAALRAAGRERIEVNAPGTTSAATLAMLANAGATQVEPGHGLTGTTPWHAVEDLVEVPAIAYVTEVSHVWNHRAYVFGGGLYVDPVLPGTDTSALVLTDPDSPIDGADELPVEMPDPAAIDYYATIPIADARPNLAGSTVIFGFRPQVFVGRGLTVALSGVSTGDVRVHGLWSADGSPASSLLDPSADHHKGEAP